MVVIDPDDPDRDEARDVGEVGRPEIEELLAQADLAVVVDRELEHEQGGSDREHAVAEGFEAPLVLHGPGSSPTSRTASSARPARVRPAAFETPRDRYAPVYYETRVRSGNVEIRIATD